MRRSACCILLVSVAINSFSQATQLIIPRNYLPAYSKNTRSADGKPGKNYWQNTADYDIQVNFFPAGRIVSGTENILYINNSPDTLNEILFKLYPNLYQQGSQRDFVIKASDVGEGVRIEKMMIDDDVISTDALRIAGTNMHVRIAPVLPGKQVKFSITYSYILNKTSHNRTGMIDDNSAFVAYFFPRIAVYDDIDGWNENPYIGSQEFYNDFCDFNVSVTVPADYLVCATGNLQNAHEVLSPRIVQRIDIAEQSDAVTKIIDTTDLSDGNITAHQHKTNTWKFEAKNVTDFVFATSNHYVWFASSLIVDTSTKRRTRVDAVFNPAHKDYFQVIDFARKTVRAMSYRFPAWPFPYPHETVFDGLDQMEYPMMVNDNPLRNEVQEIELTDHEIFHTMFPFYMGINETKYAWMDEGWATIGEWLISPMIDSSIADEYGMPATNTNSGKDVDMPVITLSTQCRGTAYFINSYPKPALGYLYLKDMLGDSLFTKALHYYIEQWHGKHPMPFDFFNSINEGCGKNLNWFWQRWFFDPGYPDLAISKVELKNGHCTIVIERTGNKPVPVDLTVWYNDGSTKKLHQSIACWQNDNKTYILTFDTGKPVKKIVLGGLYDADVYEKNNVYEIR